MEDETGNGRKVWDVLIDSVRCPQTSQSKKKMLKMSLFFNINITQRCDSDVKHVNLTTLLHSKYVSSSENITHSPWVSPLECSPPQPAHLSVISGSSKALREYSNMAVKGNLRSLTAGFSKYLGDNNNNWAVDIIVPISHSNKWTVKKKGSNACQKRVYLS